MLRLFRNCTTFAQHQKNDRLGTFSYGDSSAMRNKRNQFLFVLNLYNCALRSKTTVFTVSDRT